MRFLLLKLALPMCLIFSLGWASLVQAATSREFMRSFESQRILFPSDDSDYAAVNPGRYPRWMLWFLQHPLAWKPLGKKAEYQAGCAPQDIYQALLQEKDTRKQADLIENHKRNCGASFQNGSSWQIINAIKMMSMKLDIHHHSLFHRVIMKLPGGIRLKGLLALKGDLKKRPLVIVRIGLFSSAEEFLPERYLLMLLYEQGLANVLILENMTSPDFIANNRHFSMGGWEEGIQNIHVARLLRSPVEPLSRLVSSVHMVGVSLGGHGVIFASLLNELNSHRPERKLIQSFTAICPVINLRDTVDSLSQPGLRGAAFDYWASLRLAGLQKKIGTLSDYGWLDIFKFKSVFLPRVFTNIEEQFKEREKFLGPVKVPEEIMAIDDFWKANQFVDYYRNVESPLLVMATQEDSFVNAEKNFQWFQKESKNWNSQIGTVLFEKGFHCTLPIPYDWSTISAIFNARILGYDTEIKIKERESIFDVSNQVTEEKIAKIKLFKFDVGWEKGTNTAILHFTSDQNDQFNVKVPASELDFKFVGPMTEADRTSVERWLYQNLTSELKIENSKVSVVLRWPQIQ